MPQDYGGRSVKLVTPFQMGDEECVELIATHIFVVLNPLGLRVTWITFEDSFRTAQ